MRRALLLAVVVLTGCAKRPTYDPPPAEPEVFLELAGETWPTGGSLEIDGVRYDGLQAGPRIPLRLTATRAAAVMREPLRYRYATPCGPAEQTMRAMWTRPDAMPGEPRVYRLDDLTALPGDHVGLWYESDLLAGHHVTVGSLELAAAPAPLHVRGLDCPDGAVVRVDGTAIGRVHGLGVLIIPTADTCYQLTDVGYGSEATLRPRRVRGPAVIEVTRIDAFLIPAPGRVEGSVGATALEVLRVPCAR